MDESEELAYAYLKWRGFKSIEFEPEGNSEFPDFLVDGRIAVEVRRLNQNYIPKQPEMKIEGLEKRRNGIWNNIKKLLPSLGPPVEGVSWSVYFQFERPTPEWRLLRRAIRQHLSAFHDSDDANPTKLALFENFSLSLHRVGKIYPHRFVMGGCGDRNSGGLADPGTGEEPSDLH